MLSVGLEDSLFEMSTLWVHTDLLVASISAE